MGLVFGSKVPAGLMLKRHGLPAAGQYLVWAGGYARRRKGGLELICHLRRRRFRRQPEFPQAYRLRRKRFRRQLMVPGTFSFSNRINLKVTFDLPPFY